MNTSIAKGVWPVMVTPFTKDNRIDYHAVKSMIRWYDIQGVSGIFAVCQSSEMFFLSKQERLELVRFIVNHTPSCMGVIASGHVADTLKEQIEEAKAIIDTGIESYVFISNRLAAEHESESVVKSHVEQLIEALPDHITFGIYECPYPYKRLISPSLLRWLGKTERFTFLKDTCCNIDELKKKIDAVADTNLQVFNANAATLLESLRMGAAGYSGVMANFHADLYQWLCDNFQKLPDQADQVQNLLGAASLAECQLYPVNAKYHMQLEGVPMEITSRVQDCTLLTESKKLEIEQLRHLVEGFRKSLPKSVI